MGFRAGDFVMMSENNSQYKYLCGITVNSSQLLVIHTEGNREITATISSDYRFDPPECIKQTLRAAHAKYILENGRG